MSERKTMYLRSNTDSTLIGSGVGGDVSAAAALTENTRRMNPIVKIHPMVLFSINHHFMKREKGQDRVIGTLLGKKSAAGVVEITDSYAVPYNGTSGSKVQMDDHLNAKLYELHRRVNATEDIVGRYATTQTDGTLIPSQSYVIHTNYQKPFKFLKGNRFQNKVVPYPIHLVVDSRAIHGKMMSKAFVTAPILLGEDRMATRFQEVQVQVETSKEVRVAIDSMAKATVSKIPKPLNTTRSAMESLEKATEKLLENLTKSCQYVDKVVRGETKGNQDVGRMIASAVASVPRIRSNELEELVDNGVQDLLMIAYLSNLARSQIAISEKLSTAI